MGGGGKSKDKGLGKYRNEEKDQKKGFRASGEKGEEGFTRDK